MSSSLRSRLWLSYALLIGAALGVVVAVLFIYLLQNPLIYRQAAIRLGVVETFLLKRQEDWASLSADSLQARLQQFRQNYDVRVIIFDSRQQMLADSHAGEEAALAMPRLPRLRPAAVLRDADGNPWLYTVKNLEDGRWLMVAVKRPRVPLLTILRDEIIPPLLVAGAVALILSLLLAYWIARWVADPLQQVVTASHEVPSEGNKPLTLRGPREVQDLTRAFNDMITRVRASQVSQRDFVANVSHELKTPLTSIQGFAQAILDDTADTAEARHQAASIIYSESGRMHRMVLDLLDLARLDAGTFDLQRAPVDIGALLGSAAEKFSPQAREAGVTIHVESSTLPAVTGDGDRLAQVIGNLVDNALRHTPAGGRITLRAAPAGDGITIEVADTGKGIPPKALAHIFERFYRADPSRSGGPGHGAGLGLAIVKEIVQAHGGKISVRSTAGEGSVFTVVLPLTSPDASTVVRRRK